MFSFADWVKGINNNSFNWEKVLDHYVQAYIYTLIKLLSKYLKSWHANLINAALQNASTEQLRAAPLEGSSYAWEGNVANLSREALLCAHAVPLGPCDLLLSSFLLSFRPWGIGPAPASHRGSDHSNHFSYRHLFGILRPNTRGPLSYLSAWQISSPKISPRTTHKQGGHGFPKWETVVPSVRHYGCHTQWYLKVWEITWKGCYRTARQINSFQQQQTSTSVGTDDPQCPNCLQAVSSLRGQILRPVASFKHCLFQGSSSTTHTQVPNP